MQKEWTIPIYPELAKFAIKEFWENQTHPYVITERSIFGKLVYSVLIDKRTKIPNDTFLFSEVSITVTLSDELAKRSPSIEKLTQINSILSQMYNDKLIAWVKAQMAAKVNRYQATVSFLMHYGLTDDTGKPESRLLETAYIYVSRFINKPYRNYASQKKVDKESA